MRYDIINLLQENTGRMFSGINFSNIFLYQSHRVKEIKAKIYKWDLIKLKSTAKETIDKMKSQPTEWKKIFANDVMNKGLISFLYKELIQLNSE